MKDYALCGVIATHGISRLFITCKLVNK